MSYPFRFVLIAATLTASWLGMQAVHELGHVLGAWLTAGKIERVVLHPFSISRTDLAENPQPLIVAWAGPLGGVLIPLVLWAGSLAIYFSAFSPSVQTRLIRPLRVLLPLFLIQSARQS